MPAKRVYKLKWINKKRDNLDWFLVKENNGTISTRPIYENMKIFYNYAGEYTKNNGKKLFNIDNIGIKLNFIWDDLWNRLDSENKRRKISCMKKLQK